MTIVQGMLPYSLTAQFFGLSQPVAAPNNVQIKQCEYKHDTAVLQIWGDDVDADSYYSGMPVQVVYGRPGASRTFWGYVNHAERSNTKLKPSSMVEANSTIVYCVGASWAMKQAGTVAWQNMTISQIFTTIAQQFGLAALVEPHGTVWPHLPMAGMSYWAFCVSLAKRIGYTFFCDGIQLVARPRATNPLGLSGYVRTFDYKAAPALIPYFMPTVGATSPTGGQLLNRQMGGINPRTKTVIRSAVSGNPAPTVLGSAPDAPVFTSAMHHTVDSQAQANAYVLGAGLQNQFYMTAQATTVGDARISQGSLLYITNANGAQDGLWWVSDATHCFDVKTYSLKMALGRDSRGATTIVAFPPSVSNPPQAALVSGAWRVSA